MSGHPVYGRHSPLSQLHCHSEQYLRKTCLVLLLIVLAFPASVQQRKALKTQPHCAQQPDYAYHANQKYTGSP